jgi:rhamnosyltransferase
MNTGASWHTFSNALRRQTVRPEEVLIIDSSSDDDTVKWATQDGFRVIGIQRKDFRHGATRQIAVDQTSADLIVFLTQDALLASDDSIAQLLNIFDDTSVGAAYGRQLPRAEAGPVEAHARFFNYPAESRTNSLDSVKELGFKTIFFSNSFGAYRVSALRQVGGFPLDVNFGEDTVVAARMVLAGWNIAYVADATVYHSHAYTWLQEFHRYKAIGELHSLQGWMLEKFGGASSEGMHFLLAHLLFLARRAPHRIPGALLATACKFIGYRAGRRKTVPQIPPPVPEILATHKDKFR